MTKDQLERRGYRKSPGRQYGYDYDPLRSQRGPLNTAMADTAMPSENWSTHGVAVMQDGNRAGVSVATRPDLRRTRQLLRKNILASKSSARHTLPDQDEYERLDDQIPYNDHGNGGTSDYLAHSMRGAQPYTSYMVVRGAETAQRFTEYEGELEEEGDDVAEFVGPDDGYDDPMRRRPSYVGAASPRAVTARRVAGDYQHPLARSSDQAEYDEDEYEDDQDQHSAKRSSKRKKRGISRRKLLFGLGALVAGGVAAYELSPRVNQAIHDAEANIEHQIQNAYHNGLDAGANAVRKEFVNSIETLEGVSLDGAIAAARLTRFAYDAFVSPLVTLAATVTGDFLNITLRAVMSGRRLLALFNQDNATLAALQTVLESWVKQAHLVPQEIQTVTDTDLDGAQAYLRALQRKILAEQAILNGQKSTATPQPSVTATPKR